MDSTIKLEISTDDNGCCTFAGLDSGSYEILHYSFQNAYYKHEDTIEMSEVDSTYNFTARKKASLTIWVQYFDSTPAENTVVVIQGDSGAYEELVPQLTDIDGFVVYPEGVPEDQYTIVLKTKGGKEISRFTETISASQTNELTYYITEESGFIPGFPLWSLIAGLAAILMLLRLSQY